MTYAALGALCETLVWVLCHSLWQAALVAALVWLALRKLPARRANLRYTTALLGLAIVVVGSFLTWSVLRLEPQARSENNAAPQTSAIAASTAPQVETGPSGAAAANSARAWTTWLAGLWLLGVAVVLAWRSASVLTAQRWAAT